MVEVFKVKVGGEAFKARSWHASLCPMHVDLFFPCIKFKTHVTSLPCVSVTSLQDSPSFLSFFHYMLPRFPITSFFLSCNKMPKA